MSNLLFPAPQAGPPVMNVAQPLSDHQMVALLAAVLYPHTLGEDTTHQEDCANAVDLAIKLFAETIQNGGMAKLREQIEKTPKR